MNMAHADIKSSAATHRPFFNPPLCLLELIYEYPVSSNKLAATYIDPSELWDLCCVI